VKENCPLFLFYILFSLRFSLIDSLHELGFAKQLEKLLTRDRWKAVNKLLVGFGQTICAPVNPKCADCRLFHNALCPRVGVGRQTGLKRAKTI
jgi:endonuclease III